MNKYLTETAKTDVNPIDKAVYRCVAVNKGGSHTHKAIMLALEKAFSSKNQVTRIMNGTTTISMQDLTLIKSVLIEYDATIIIDDLIG